MELSTFQDMEKTFNNSDQNIYLYSHGNDSICKYGLPFEIDSRPQSNDTTIIAKPILTINHISKPKVKKTNYTTYLVIIPSLYQIKLLTNDGNKASI